ncbi:MAG TPA: hypothetical protein VEC36_04465 [Patescibacteria group bacterium]|nr:hypothetical protein [Patescibacteria group bacterium]
MKQFLASLQLKSESSKTATSFDMHHEDRAPQFTHQRHKNGFIAEWETIGNSFEQLSAAI